MGAFFHVDGVAATVRNAMMAGRASDDYTMLDWLYGHRAGAPGSGGTSSQ
jgi:hypothetical protein